MIETSLACNTEIASTCFQSLPELQDSIIYAKEPKKRTILNQIIRFGLVGGMNTLVDLLILNALLVLLPTTNSLVLLSYNALTYGLGAVNSLFINKYWTFGEKKRMTSGEVTRFTITTLFGIIWSCGLVWLASNILHPFAINATLWANASKIVAIAGTALISYLGMRLWVFVKQPHQS